MLKTKSPKNTKISINKNFQDCIFTLLIFAIMLIIITNPKRFTTGTISGLKLFFSAVLPGLFPFMLLTKLLTEIGYLYKFTSKFGKISNALFSTSGVSLYVLAMSVLSGYPIGSKIIADLYQKEVIDETEAKRMSVFCTTSGPIFVIGSVGASLFGNIKIGVILYVSHIASSIILGVLYKILTKSKNNITTTNIVTITQHSQDNIFANCVTQTINSLFVVGAYITIFYLIAEIFDSLKIIDILTNLISPIFEIFGIKNQTTKGVLYGILEVTRGAKELSSFSSPISIALCCGIISFSGISIIMQSMAFLKQAKIKAHNFVLAKCVHGILSVFLCYLLLIIM